GPAASEAAGRGRVVHSVRCNGAVLSRVLDRILAPRRAVSVQRGRQSQRLEQRSRGEPFEGCRGVSQVCREMPRGVPSSRMAGGTDPMIADRNIASACRALWRAIEAVEADEAAAESCKENAA